MLGDTQAPQASQAAGLLPHLLPFAPDLVLKKPRQNQQQKRRDKTPEDERMAGGAMMYVFRL